MMGIGGGMPSYRPCLVRWSPLRGLAEWINEAAVCQNKNSYTQKRLEGRFVHQ